MALFPILAGLGALAGCMSNPRRKRRKARRRNPGTRSYYVITRLGKHDKYGEIRYIGDIYRDQYTLVADPNKAMKFATRQGAKHAMRDVRGRGFIVTRPRLSNPGKRRNPDGDEVAAHELMLFIVNDGDLYRQQTQPILKNLAKKVKKGVYDSEKALKLWGYLADAGAQKYTKEDRARNRGTVFGSSYGIFNKMIRYVAAMELQTYYQEDLDDTVKSNPRRRRSKRSRR